MENETQYCSKCRRTMTVDNFYTYKNGEKVDLCKKCLTMHVNNFDPDTFLWILEKMDVPYIEEEWNVLRDRAFEKDPDKLNGMSVLGKYLSKMRLKKWKDYGWKDTKALAEIAKQKQEEAKKAKKKGAAVTDNESEKEMSTAEYLTLSDTADHYDAYIQALSASAVAQPGGNPSGIGSKNMYNENEFISEDELVDLGAELTHDDKIYLAMKWGRLYKASEWVELEKKYNDMKKSFNIVDSDTESSLILICKTYLKMNQALDAGDLEAYNKLSKAYESLRKSAKFTAVQNKDGDKGNINSVGEMVAFCERNGGKIPKFDLSVDLDIVDKVIRDMKDYTKSLIYDDPALARQIETYIQKRENAEAEKKDKEEAKKHGLLEPILSDGDHVRYKEFLQQQVEEDAAMLKKAGNEGAESK